MDYDIPVVEEDPAGIRRTLDPSLLPELGRDALVDGVQNGPQLTIALTRTDDKVIRDGVQRPQIQHDDITGLFLFR